MSIDCSVCVARKEDISHRGRVEAYWLRLRWRWRRDKADVGDVDCLRAEVIRDVLQAPRFAPFWSGDPDGSWTAPVCVCACVCEGAMQRPNHRVVHTRSPQGKQWTLMEVSRTSLILLLADWLEAVGTHSGSHYSRTGDHHPASLLSHSVSLTPSALFLTKVLFLSRRVSFYTVHSFLFNLQMDFLKKNCCKDWGRNVEGRSVGYLSELQFKI